MAQREREERESSSRELRFSAGNQPPALRLRSILVFDYPTLLCLLGPVAVWAIYALAVIEGGQGSSQTFLGVAGGITVLCAAAFLLRVRVFLGVFSRGVEVRGEVVDIGFYKDRGSVAFSYEYGGKVYTTTRALHKSRAGQALEPGQAIVVVVDESNPKKALIRDLFA